MVDAAGQYAQELLSTFSTSLAEVALQPSTGGTFVVTIHHVVAAPPGQTEQEGAGAGAGAAGLKILWDRKEDGGFPETKELKRRVRDVIEPKRDLGHVDRDHRKEKDANTGSDAQEMNVSEGKDGSNCEDCTS